MQKQSYDYVLNVWIADEFTQMDTNKTGKEYWLTLKKWRHYKPTALNIFFVLKTKYKQQHKLSISFFVFIIH